IRIFGCVLVGSDMEGPDPVVIGSLEPEMARYLAQIHVFGRADPAIGERDVEQPAKKIFEDHPVIREQTPDLTGIALKTGGALAGEVKDQPDMLLLARRDLEDLTKGGDFVAGNGAVGPGHLGAERDHRDCEGDSPAWVASTAFALALRIPARNVA